METKIIAGIAAFGPLIVESLPSEGIENILYLVDNHNGTYREYLWTNKKWMYYGDSNIDLSIYYEKDEVDALLEALSFNGTRAQWDALSEEEKTAYIVAKVRG